MRIWLAIVVGSALSVAALWWTAMPLGIPGEWTWDRSPVEPDLAWNLACGVLAITGVIAFLMRGFQHFNAPADSPRYRRWTAAWLCGLAITGFAWLWIVQEVAASKNRIGKSAMVLFYRSSSGYFTRARYEQPDVRQLLGGYEALMREGDVLHTGTHPPGLFVIFHGLIAACDASPLLSQWLDATQPLSFREGCDVIAVNNLRLGREKYSFVPTDRRVLWLATLIVTAAAALGVVPLFALLRRHVAPRTAWMSAALWIAVPAVAIFIPKSDVAFSFAGLTLLWVWLRAWDTGSWWRGCLAGIIAWCCLFCSLAFLPVFLLAALMTLGTWLSERSAADQPLSGHVSHRRPVPWTVLIAATLAFAILTGAVWYFAGLNLPNVWWLNYQNHAGFYRHYPRTFFKWLLVNPLELSFAMGWPIAALALAGFFNLARQAWHHADPGASTRWLQVVGPISVVGGLLWLTGKNSGEAARIWIFLMPWVVWVASFRIEQMLEQASTDRHRTRTVRSLFLIQWLVCLLTVTRVSGFHPDS